MAVTHHRFYFKPPIHPQEKESVAELVKLTDKANGYVFGDTEKYTNDAVLETTAQQRQFDYDRVQTVMEKYIGDGGFGDNDEAPSS